MESQPQQRRTQTMPQPRSERWGPEIYVHLEFRVSWGGKKQEPSKNHQVTYRSRNARERSPAFPRQVPAPNTNYLAAIHSFDQRQSRIREARQSHPLRHHQMQEYYQREQLEQSSRQRQQQQQQPPTSYLQVPIIREPQRPTRANAPPSYERGRSAPPPIGENPWDVAVPHVQVGGDSVVTPSDRNTREIRRKPLPAPPSTFRLGDGGQPWSTWSLPDGYDPDMHPKDEDDVGYRGYRGRSRAHDHDDDDDNVDDDKNYEDIPVISAPADRNSTTFATNPTMVSTFSPEPVLPRDSALTTTQHPDAPPPTPAHARDLETGRAKELGALSAAMMTVDNGFETQWWYQGHRDTVHLESDDHEPEHEPEPRTPDESPIHRWSLTPLGTMDNIAASMSMSATASPTDLTLMHQQLQLHQYQQQQLQQQRGRGREQQLEDEERLPAGVVSPMSDNALSPAMVPASLLQRTLSTRSEELWLRERI
ncbi:uncharacterized protein C8A04DRAFT_34834 [Dichotomopilus funicola]|uniref:Uncharacterized protein n=1 Tax=Dichotomopilus funicola TaxID=1934379 RepID=A0AAN6V8A8_9PEZI|nr:hypothetical protein C8A04DRAFT_34834 [Dichotomopilus funicola]